MNHAVAVRPSSRLFLVVNRVLAHNIKNIKIII